MKKGMEMTRIMYVEKSGQRHDVDVPEGTSLMEGAVQNNIFSIKGDCGGGLACATCHVHIGEAWIAKTGALHEMEIAMLDSSVEDRSPQSRLSCQITVTAALEGMIVFLTSE